MPLVRSWSIYHDKKARDLSYLQSPLRWLSSALFCRCRSSSLNTINVSHIELMSHFSELSPIPVCNVWFLWSQILKIKSLLGLSRASFTHQAVLDLVDFQTQRTSFTGNRGNQKREGSDTVSRKASHWVTEEISLAKSQVTFLEPVPGETLFSYSTSKYLQVLSVYCFFVIQT